MNLSIEAESFRPLNPPILGDFKILVPLKLGGLGGQFIFAFSNARKGKGDRFWGRGDRVGFGSSPQFLRLNCEFEKNPHNPAIVLSRLRLPLASYPAF